jgi:uncharacterized protein
VSSHRDWDKDHGVDILLNQVEVRVLGALVEKDVITPEYYPLSLNALLNACNQKNNRDPVMSLTEDDVRQALHGLQEKHLAGPVTNAENRVTKYEHRLQEVFNFTRGENAIFGVLLLRGPQTPGQLRSRSERMHRFEDLADLQNILESLMHRDPPLVRVLPRQPGTREVRYAHLLSGDVESKLNVDADTSQIASSAPIFASPADSQRIAHLENEVVALQKEVADLKQQLTAFRKEFE